MSESHYANYFEVGHNGLEFIIDCGVHYEDAASPSFHTRIVTNPIYAKALLGVLATSIEQYEAKFGKIRDV